MAPCDVACIWSSFTKIQSTDLVLQALGSFSGKSRQTVPLLREAEAGPARLFLLGHQALERVPLCHQLLAQAGELALVSRLEP